MFYYVAEHSDKSRFQGLVSEMLSRGGKLYGDLQILQCQNTKGFRYFQVIISEEILEKPKKVVDEVRRN